MLGGIIKLTLFFNVLFMFIVLIWQAATINASPILTNNGYWANSNDDMSYLSAIDTKPRGALIVKRSVHSPVADQQSLIDSSRLRSRVRHRRLRKKLSSSKLKNSPSIFQSTGIKKKNNILRASKRLQTVVDDRLKRFRMLDPDEFQEMLNSWSHQVPDHPIKELDNMDTIGGMQLENYWLRK